METSNTSDFQERRVGPTVSKDKWLNHAKAKLAKGYVLIVGKERRTANFYLRSKGFEMCPHNVAKQLIKEELVVEDGEHPLGTMYKLAGDVKIETKRKPAPEPRERREELEEIIVAEEVDETEAEGEDEEESPSEEVE